MTESAVEKVESDMELGSLRGDTTVPIPDGAMNCLHPCEYNASAQTGIESMEEART
jgi:hypothetical protein